MATSYANNSGTGDRRQEIVTTTTFATAAEDGGTDWTILIDGVTGSNAREPSNATGDKTLTWDWGPNASIVIDKLKFYNSLTTTYGANWTVEGSNNGSTWTTLKSAFTLSGSTTGTEFTWTNSTGYRYYRIHTTNMANGGGSSGFWREFEFSVEDITPQGSRPSWYNAGGHGSRTGLITGSTNMSLTSGTIPNALDGDYTANSTHSFQMQNGSNTGLYVRFDFGAGVSVVIDTVHWYQSGTAAHGTWKVQGSNDASSWTDVGSSFTLGGASGVNTYQLGGNTTGYRYYQIIAVSGSANSTPFIEEIEFRIDGITTLARTYKLSGYGVIVPANAKPYKLSGYAVLVPLAAVTPGIVVIIASG